MKGDILMSIIDAKAIRTISTPWSSSLPEKEFTVEDPSTSEVTARVKGSSPEDVDRAIVAANEVFEKDWRWRDFFERAGILQECARIIEQNAEEIAELESLEMGKPFTQAMNDVRACINTFKMFSAHSYNLPSSIKEEGSVMNLCVLEPYGVVGGIVPFNWPPIHTAGKIAPALAVGNSVVLKPPEQAPSSIVRIVELINTILPENLVNVVCGFGDVGAAIATHPLVRMVSFTGSPRTGAMVLKSLAQNFTPSIMELGGKNPIIIFDDADIEVAIPWVIDGAFYNQGEACTAASRILVHSSLEDKLIESLKAAVPKLKVGDPMDRRTHVGPLVTSAQQKVVMDYIEIGVNEGAVIAAQAPVPTEEKYKNGCWAPPTLFVNVRPDMRIAKEEIFGPVTAVIPFDTYEEAIEIANGTEFGLVAGVFSKNFETCWRASRELKCGLVLANNFNRVLNNGGTPHGGVKASGFGREHTLDTVREFGHTKTLRIPTGIGRETPKWFAVAEVLE